MFFSTFPMDFIDGLITPSLDAEIDGERLGQENQLCNMAVEFCDSQKEHDYVVLQTILIPECGEGTHFVISRDECLLYF